MIKNTLYSTGQEITLAVGQTYTLKDDEVFINNVLYKKKDLEITTQNIKESNISDVVKVGIRKRDGINGLPADFVFYNEWEVDGVTQTSLADCIENINSAIYYEGGLSASSTTLPDDTLDSDGNPLEATKIYVYTDAGYVEADALNTPTGVLNIGSQLSDGEVDGFTGLVDGDNYYINEGGGIISETDMNAQFQMGSIVRKVGQAKSQTILYFDPDESFLELNIEVSTTSGYSTDEVVLDETWIDGKPIYRKVFTETIGAGGILVDVSALNIERCIKRWGDWDNITNFNENRETGGYLGFDADKITHVDANIFFYKQDDEIYITFLKTVMIPSTGVVSTSRVSIGEIITFTIEYTKTTD